MTDIANYVVEQLLSSYRTSGRDYFLEFYNNQYGTNYTASDLNDTTKGDFKQGTQKFDLYNAFQHAYSSGMLTEQTNSDFAENLGNLKEKYQQDRGDYDTLDHLRDLYNNKKGRDVGNQIKNDNTIPDNEKLHRIAEDLFDKLMNDELCTDKDDSLGLWDNHLPDPFYNLFPDTLGKIQTPFNQSKTAFVRVDPIVFDLNGDGTKTTTVENGVYFDNANDGFAESTAWVDANDGILVVDTNANSTIDNGTELVTNLSTFDTNNDGVINSSDTNFSSPISIL